MFVPVFSTSLKFWRFTFERYKRWSQSAWITMAAAHILQRHLNEDSMAALLISTLKTHESPRGWNVPRLSAVVNPDPRGDLWSEWDVLSGRSVLDPPSHDRGLSPKRSFVLIAAIDRSSSLFSLHYIAPVAAAVLVSSKDTWASSADFTLSDYLSVEF